MCGRVIQSSALLRLAIVDGLEVNDSRLRNVPRRYKLRRARSCSSSGKTTRRSLDLLKWDLIPNWCQDPRGGRKPINAKAESVSKLLMFRDA
jgi:putative SOS response-associated peptidase YedK